MRNTRKLASLALIVLLAPACILVAKDGDWDRDEDQHAMKSHMEHRVAQLEQQLAECKAGCPMPCCKEPGQQP